MFSNNKAEESDISSKCIYYTLSIIRLFCAWHLYSYQSLSLAFGLLTFLLEILIDFFFWRPYVIAYKNVHLTIMAALFFTTEYLLFVVLARAVMGEFFNEDDFLSSTPYIWLRFKYFY